MITLCKVSRHVVAAKLTFREPSQISRLYSLYPGGVVLGIAVGIAQSRAFAFQNSKQDDFRRCAFSLKITEFNCLWNIMATVRKIVHTKKGVQPIPGVYR